MIIGYACPGLSENLNLSDSELTKDIELPEYVEVTADVTDFELDFTATGSTGRMFPEIHLKAEVVSGFPS